MRGALKQRREIHRGGARHLTSDLCIGNSADPDKSFIINIFTSNPLQLKILQTLFANPAPVEAFRGDRGGGLPTCGIFPGNGNLLRLADWGLFPDIF
jgi:hypothetical protein